MITIYYAVPCAYLRTGKREEADEIPVKGPDHVQTAWEHIRNIHPKAELYLVLYRGHVYFRE